MTKKKQKATVDSVATGFGSVESTATLPAPPPLKLRRASAPLAEGCPCGLDSPADVQLHLATHWPKDKPLPTHKVTHRREPMPCPKCRRIRLDDGGQATVATTTEKLIAWFRCRACGHRFCMPIKELRQF